MNSTSLLMALLLGAALFIGIWVYQNNAARNAAEAENQEQVEKGFLTTRKDFNDKLEEIKQRREEIIVQIDRLEERKKATGKKLKELGVSTADDLAKNDQANLEFSNLKRLMADVEKYKQDIKVYDQAIGRIGAALADLERQELKKNAGIGEEQSRQLNTIIKDIDDRLIEPASPIDQLETQDILDDILGDETLDEDAA